MLRHSSIHVQRNMGWTWYVLLMLASRCQAGLVFTVVNPRVTSLVSSPLPQCGYNGPATWVDSIDFELHVTNTGPDDVVVHQAPHLSPAYTTIRTTQESGSLITLTHRVELVDSYCSGDAVRKYNRNRQGITALCTAKLPYHPCLQVPIDTPPIEPRETVTVLVYFDATNQSGVYTPSGSLLIAEQFGTIPVETTTGEFAVMSTVLVLLCLCIIGLLVIAATGTGCVL